jgi:hypothetical protein
MKIYSTPTTDFNSLLNSISEILVRDGSNSPCKLEEDIEKVVKERETFLESLTSLTTSINYVPVYQVTFWAPKLPYPINTKPELRVMYNSLRAQVPEVNFQVTDQEASIWKTSLVKTEMFPLSPLSSLIYIGTLGVIIVQDSYTNMCMESLVFMDIPDIPFEIFQKFSNFSISLSGHFPAWPGIFDIKQGDDKKLEKEKPNETILVPHTEENKLIEDRIALKKYLGKY